MNKALHKSREQTLGHEINTKNIIPKSKNEKIRVDTTFGTRWNQLRTILTKHWHILLYHRLKDILGPMPNLIAKRAPTLGDVCMGHLWKDSNVQSYINLNCRIGEETGIKYCYRKKLDGCSFWTRFHLKGLTVISHYIAFYKYCVSISSIRPGHIITRWGVWYTFLPGSLCVYSI